MGRDPKSERVIKGSFRPYSTRAACRVVLSIEAILAGMMVPWCSNAAGIQTLNEVEVRADARNLIGTTHSANEGTVLKRQLEQRTVYRPGELFETVPGLIVTQHSGEGIQSIQYQGARN